LQNGYNNAVSNLSLKLGYRKSEKQINLGRFMKTFEDFITECLETVEEILPWDLQALLESGKPLLLLDVREPYEFDACHIKGSLNVPRGILETACEYDYEDTVPELVTARDKEIVVICRSGKRSILSAYTIQLMGFKSVKSLKLGMKGWNDYELPVENAQGQMIETDQADTILYVPLRPEQMKPKS
jgi:rhodanese-related sulfurtransferase